SPTELIDPISTLSGKKPELRATKHWYFKLDKHNDWLKEWVEKGTLDGQPHHDPNTWKKHVTGQCLSWLNEGLQARAITRDLNWGIKVPLADAEGKVLYVWFDAPIGYISSTKAWAEENGQDWKKYWQDEETELIHFIGKDNIVFHCIIFPAMLKAHGNYVLPKNVPANQFLNFEGQKFSKSRGWGIEQHEYLEAFKDFPNKEDALRWALIRNLPEQRDADFTWGDFVDFHDKELADKLGNFVNRVTVLTHKYFTGAVPEVAAESEEQGWQALVKKISASIEKYQFKQAALDFVELATWGNVYLQEAAPWAIAKEDPEDPRIAQILDNCLQLTTAISIVCAPFIPFTATRLRDLLQLPPIKNGDWLVLQENLLNARKLLATGHQIGESVVLFPKIDDRRDNSRMQIVDAQREKLKAILSSEAGPERPSAKEEINFDDFTKLDLRTATITEAAPIKKADKLLQLTVDLGNETRTVVSGIAKHYKPEEIIGKQVVLVTNLAPRKMRGVLSQGMILMAEDGEGKLAFVSPPGGFDNGWVVR
ncbi:MAG: methionine--tRNA ligase subunit beta, partial [Bacteroidota bacterium]